MANVWCADDTFLGDLIFLGRENLVVDSPKESDTPSIRDALLAGKSPASVLSSDAVNIPLHAVKKISTDRHDRDIEIEYVSGKDKEEHTLRLKTPEKRDEVFAALKAAYGERFEQFEEAYNRPQAMFMPLLSFTIFGLLTMIFALAAAEIRESADYEISGSNQGAKQLFAWALELIGPIGVWIIGGFLTFLCAAAVFLAAKQPPVMLTLQEPPYRNKSNIALVFKYAVLAFLWFLGYRIISGFFL